MIRHIAVTLFVITLLAAFGLCAFVVIMFDPYDWGVVQSSKFSWKTFSTVREGDSIEAVKIRLGDPVRQPLPYTVLSVDQNDPCVRKRCYRYVFAGANWGMSYKEGIVIVDESGRVVHAQVRQE